MHQFPHDMFRTSLLLISLTSAVALHAQKDALSTLTASGSQQWSVIGNSTSADCRSGDARYTFQAKQVVVATCTGGEWKSSTQALTTWSANGRSGIAFGGAKYEVKALPATAPACKGNANCVRLATVPDGKTDATRTIYLTH